MPRGEPTRTVRLPVWLLDRLASEAGSADRVPALITRKLGGARKVAPLGAAPQRRCSCPKPVLSKYATNVCTACGRTRG